MQVSDELKKQIHEQCAQMAQKQADIIIRVYNDVYKDMPPEFTEEQQKQVMDKVFSQIFDSFSKAIDEQKKAADLFFKDKENTDKIINSIKHEQEKANGSAK